MSRRIGKEMVKLVGQDAGKGAAVSCLPAWRRKPEKTPLYEKTHALAIDIDKRKYFAVAHMGPAERTGITPLRPQVLGIALPFEMNDRQLGRNPPAGFGQGMPVEM